MVSCKGWFFSQIVLACLVWSCGGYWLPQTPLDLNYSHYDRSCNYVILPQNQTNALVALVLDNALSPDASTYEGDEILVSYNWYDSVHFEKVRGIQQKKQKHQST